MVLPRLILTQTPAMTMGIHVPESPSTLSVTSLFDLTALLVGELADPARVDVKAVEEGASAKVAQVGGLIDVETAAFEVIEEEDIVIPAVKIGLQSVCR